MRQIDAASPFGLTCPECKESARVTNYEAASDPPRYVFTCVNRHHFLVRFLRGLTDEVARILRSHMRA